MIVTADHGGVPDTTKHTDRERSENYTIPFLVWGPGITPGDLYALNRDYRTPARAGPGTTGRSRSATETSPTSSPTCSVSTRCRAACSTPSTTSTSTDVRVADRGSGRPAEQPAGTAASRAGRSPPGTPPRRPRRWSPTTAPRVGVVDRDLVAHRRSRGRPTRTAVTSARPCGALERLDRVAAVVGLERLPGTATRCSGTAPSHRRPPARTPPRSRAARPASISRWLSVDDGNTQASPFRAARRRARLEPGDGGAAVPAPERRRLGGLGLCPDSASVGAADPAPVDPSTSSLRSARSSAVVSGWGRRHLRTAAPRLRRRSARRRGRGQQEHDGGTAAAAPLVVVWCGGRWDERPGRRRRRWKPVGRRRRAEVGGAGGGGGPADGGPGGGGGGRRQVVGEQRAGDPRGLPVGRRRLDRRDVGAAPTQKRWSGWAAAVPQLGQSTSGRLLSFLRSLAQWRKLVLARITRL